MQPAGSSSTRRFLATVAAISIAMGAPASVAQLSEPPPGVDGRSIALRAEDNMRSSRTYFEGTMSIASPRLTTPRKVRFKSWGERDGKRSFIRILDPAKDAGTGFLKLHPNLWMYIPRVERTIRIPPSMMLQSWMGSDFTNDDLVKESSEIDDYDHRLLGVDEEGISAGGRRSYVVEYIPHEDTAVVWGRIVTWIDVETGAPLRQEFFDEEGEKLRVMTFREIREVGVRHVPHRWVLTPVDKPGHQTLIELHTIRFDETFDDDVFTTRNLKRER